VGLSDPGRAEDRDAVVDVAQGLEAALDLIVDAAEAQGVLLLDVAGSAQQQLVVLPGGDVTLGAYIAPNVTRPPLPASIRPVFGLAVGSMTRTLCGSVKEIAGRTVDTQAGRSPWP
jgi:hypothetical protein